jgi:predicted XRE-type DNA-binding protein
MAEKKSQDRGIAVRKSSGNVFADLRLPEPGEALAKAQLAATICAIIRRRKLTQAKAAQLLGIDQPKVSALMNGRLAGFSTDRLFRFLNALGHVVEISIKRAGKTSARSPIAGVRVVGSGKQAADR